MSATTRIAAGLLLLAVGIVPAAAVGATLVRAAGAPEWIEIPFRLVCHGIDSRSLPFAGVVMPICSRCFALYLGGLAGIAFALAIPPLRRRPIPAAALLLAVLPMALDGVSQAAGLRESSNLLRIGTGLLAGAATLIWLVNRIEHAAREQEPLVLN
ncbi:MAG TPA: DUF2085 domain-containing protein [Thermoanaerobaculia bacterium]|nr:DUF2085 domain-containing protein [Thermoanaerobaculia bacterium]